MTLANASTVIAVTGNSHPPADGAPKYSENSGVSWTDLFDLLLTDLGMPEMSGWDVARAAKKCLSNLPVMLVTGWGDHIDPSRLAGTGVDWVLAKPYTLSELLTGLSKAWGAIHEGARGEKAQSPVGSQLEDSDRRFVSNRN